MSKGKALLADCIQRKRVALMLAYQTLFTEDPQGRSLHEKWSKDEILPSSKDGQKFIKTMMKAELDERQLATLQEQYMQLVYKEVEGIK